MNPDQIDFFSSKKFMFKKNINKIYSSRSIYYIIHDNRATNYISLEFYNKPNCLKSPWHVNVQLVILFKNENYHNLLTHVIPDLYRLSLSCRTGRIFKIIFQMFLLLPSIKIKNGLNLYFFVKKKKKRRKSQGFGITCKTCSRSGVGNPRLASHMWLFHPSAMAPCSIGPPPPRLLIQPKLFPKCVKVEVFKGQCE